jgi:putative transposase
LEIQQAFTSYNNPKGNADTERVMRTLKEECLWLQEWTCPFTLTRALETWIDDYNEHYLHSALGYKPPRQFDRRLVVRYERLITTYAGFFHLACALLTLRKVLK